MTQAIVSLAIHTERDIVLARQRARQVTEILGFDVQDQTRVATAVSEIARNAFQYAGGGRLEFRVEGSTAPQVLFARVTDRGPGIRDLESVLDGSYRSATGMGIGIIGSRRLMDHFEITSAPGQGTTVVLKKLLPAHTPLVDDYAVARLGEKLATRTPENPLEEAQRQNQDLLRTLDELSRRQEELRAINQELEDTNRGVVALYAELDERADHLRRADEVKSRFLSNMSHEFRTPVNSILALSRLLLDRLDGDLTAEQEKQLSYIRKAAGDLSELVNDLLDLAKVEAGKTVVRAIDFEIGELFGALRGMLRPLLVSESVTLVFEDPEELQLLHTDQAKVSQILRNLISNALKFTERGEVRIQARRVPGEDAVAFSVTDTGIGIALEDQERIFQEFSQVENPLQRHVKGTGLGLPLCRRLAALLGGRVTLQSQPGVGSTFTAVIPIVYAAAVRQAPVWEIDPARIPVLVIEDRADVHLLYERFLAGSRFQPLAARTLREAAQCLDAITPKAIVLDILLGGEHGWTFLTEIKRSPTTRGIPVLVLTEVDDETKAVALGADAFCLKPVDHHRLVRTLTQLTMPPPAARVLVVDDEDVARYVLRQRLTSLQYVVLEAATGAEALRVARAEKPDVICLDLMMPGEDGTSVLGRLKADPMTQDIPVVIVTSKGLEDVERQALLRLAGAILSKEAAGSEAGLATIEHALRAAARAA